MVATLTKEKDIALNTLTEIHGKGKWLEDGEIFEIHSILGSLSEGNSIVKIHSNSTPGTIELRKFESEKIVFFVSEEMKHY